MTQLVFGGGTRHLDHVADGTGLLELACQSLEAPGRFELGDGSSLPNARSGTTCSEMRQAAHWPQHPSPSSPASQKPAQQLSSVLAQSLAQQQGQPQGSEASAFSLHTSVV